MAAGRGLPAAVCSTLIQEIIEDGYSPAAALAKTKEEGYTFTICATTLYSYIDKGVFLHLTNNYRLREKTKREHTDIQRLRGRQRARA